MTKYYTEINSIIGNLYVMEENGEIVAIHIGESEFLEENKSEIIRDDDHPLLLTATKQLQEYFEGIRQDFDLPIKVSGTSFQKAVWEVLGTIPYGETWSYQQVSEAIGNPKAVRAVGQANRANMIPIVIPCHRVIGKNGKLVGYSGSKISLKEKLLEHEKALLK